jgi:hypothetical protein
VGAVSCVSLAIGVFSLGASPISIASAIKDLR